LNTLTGVNERIWNKSNADVHFISPVTSLLQKIMFLQRDWSEPTATKNCKVIEVDKNIYYEKFIQKYTIYLSSKYIKSLCNDFIRQEIFERTSFDNLRIFLTLLLICGFGTC